MLADLFGDEESSFDNQDKPSGTSSSCNVPRPVAARGPTSLCGLSNLGATCYMNALLQTLYYTPELRESLFALSEEELGIGKDMARTIPIELRSLFAKMLLADQDNVGVEGLITSFGWTNNEEMQQHDVQELNRILFDALESSLIGTSGQRLLAELYHGTSVQQITCQKCDKVSEREEDFLDIPVALTGNPDLQAALKAMYCDVETLDGNNQYKCANCQQLVDAKRGCTVRALPPVLTFALMRFLYDYDKGQRYKELSSFKFPLTVDMKPFLDKTKIKEEEDYIYDLFSVVIHSGSTHSGHYTAYVRDIDNLGSWTHPENEPISYQKSTSVEFPDVIEFHSPLELIQNILTQCQGSATLSKLCKVMQDQTGVSWNKRFKQYYGPITKFIRNHSEVFDIDASNNISLKDMTIISNSLPISNVKEGATTLSDKLEAKPKKESPSPGECWYEFNDSRVSSIWPSSIEKMFSGRESAYMLFYRSRSLIRPKEAFGNRVYGIPQQLQNEVGAINALLQHEREEYEVYINTINITVHPVPYYQYRSGALHNIMDGLTHPVKIDRRVTIAELKATLLQEVGEPVSISDGMVIHTVNELPAGLHIYDCVASNNGDDELCTLTDKGITTDCHIFVWDGKMVNGEIVPVGKDNQPILLRLNYIDTSNGSIEESIGFSVSANLQELRKYFCVVLNCLPQEMTLSQVQRSKRSGEALIVPLPFSKDSVCLSELFSDGDCVTAELKVKKGTKSFAHTVADKKNKLMTFLVENRCTNIETSNEYFVYPVEVEKNQKLFQVKHQILLQLNISDIFGGGRLRIDDDIQGLGPPLCEELGVMDAGIQPGMRVVLEPGPAPLSNQISLRFKVKGMTSEFNDVILNKKCTIQECCHVMVASAGLQGDDWHLCKGNWCGEETGNVLDDEMATIEEAKLYDGDYVVVENGRLPPKGYIRISVYLYVLDKVVGVADEETATPTSILDYQQVGIEAMDSVTLSSEDNKMKATGDGMDCPLHEVDPAIYYPPVYGSLQLLGDIEINKESSIQNLKEHILTLPHLDGLDVPTTDFIRVRELTNGGRPGRVFKDQSISLKKLKLSTGNQLCCQVLPNEDKMAPTCILINVQMRDSISRTYGHPMEVVYDTSHSVSPSGLLNYLSDLLGLPPERMQIAKHKFEVFEWIIFDTSSSNNVTEDKSKKGRKKKGGGGKGGAKNNIKNSPYSLKDGDLIGVKDIQYDIDGSDDFMTDNDIKGKLVLTAIQEDKRQRRKIKLNEEVTSGDGKKHRRPEVGIKIFVPDFTKNFLPSSSNEPHEA